MLTRRLCRSPEKKNPDTAYGTSKARRFSRKIDPKWSMINWQPDRPEGNP